MTGSQPAALDPRPPSEHTLPPEAPPDPPDGPPIALAVVPRSPHPSVVCRELPGLLLLLAALVGCNDHPLDPFEETVVGTMREVSDLPARSKVDLLFVIDDSGSMCEEQASLTAEFGRLADFFFDRLGAEADLRIAVTSTDVANQGGRFLAVPPALGALTCDGFEMPALDCADMVDTPVLSTGPDGNVGRDCGGVPADERGACVRADLERRFRCLATRGTTGSSREQGLEAMRLALSCDGPNGAHFGACCTEAGFDPTCAAEGPAPDFLRPDAQLAVVVVSDEDDCSVPALNPAASDRVICKYGPGDADADGVPDGYGDDVLCGARDAADCFRAECGDLDAMSCAHTRCDIQGQSPSSCVWEQHALTPVEDYARFLARLKASPAEQLLVAAIVGERVYTPNGFPITFAPGDPAVRGAACQPVDVDGPIDLDDGCCPEGVCLGEVQPACETDIGTAFTGDRYLKLAEAIGAVGVQCVDPASSLCNGDLVGPLDALTGCIQEALVFFCLDKPIADPAQVQVALSCLDEERCDRPMPPRALDEADFRVSPDERCVGGWALYLTDPPAAGAKLEVRYTVAL